MSTNVFSSFRAPKQILNSVSLHLQCLRTIATLKYFHPHQPTTSPKELYGKDRPELPPMPPYPYGPNRNYPQADTGLYGGAQVQSGNRISKGRNKGKSLRRWYPNVRVENVRSEALGQDFSIRITASCLRTINKCGGLDQYLLGEKPARIKELGLLGWRLRWRVINSNKIMAVFQEKREKLGLSGINPAVERFEEAWQRPEVREKLTQVQVEAWDKLKEKNQRFEDHIRRTWEKADRTEHEITNMAVLMKQSPLTIEIPTPPTLEVKRKKEKKDNRAGTESPYQPIHVY